MFTNNFKKMMRPRIMQMLGMTENLANVKLNSAYNGTTAIYAETNYYGGQLDIIDAMNSMSSVTGRNYCPSSSYSGINVGYAFGNGTEEPTADDVWISGDLLTRNKITPSMVTKAQTVSDDVENGITTVSTTYTISNTTTSDITISEVAIVGGYALKFQSSGDFWSYPLLYERTLLDTPVTIPAGGVGQVTYTITVSGSPV